MRVAPVAWLSIVHWTPCIGPILASIYIRALSLAGQKCHVASHLSARLGVASLISELFFSKLSISLGWLKRRSVFIQRVSGVILIIIGALMLTGKRASIFAPLHRYFRLPI